MNRKLTLFRFGGDTLNGEQEAPYLAWTDAPPNKHPGNWAPKGFTEVDAGHIAMKTCWGAFYPEVTEFRQFALATPRGEEHTSVYLHYFFDNTGVAYVVDPRPPGAIRWFIFGCTAPEHTIHYCATCGHKAQFDSSD